MRSRIRHELHATARRAGACAAAAALAVMLAACSDPPPRSFADFMDDRIAREGVLARCDLDPEASRNDIECANARRAAVTIALREERARREQFERESERKLRELRAQIGLREQAAREAAAAAARAAEQAYEAQWEDGAAGTIPVPLDAPAEGTAVSSGSPRAEAEAVYAPAAGPELHEITPPRRPRLEF